MAGEVHEYVDAVGANLRGQCCVIQRCDRAKRGEGGNGVGDPILELSGAVAKNLHLRRIMCADHMFEKEADGVLAKIGGDVADAQRLVGQRGARGAGVRTTGTLFGPRAPLPGLGETRIIGYCGVVFQVGECIAADDGVIGQLCLQVGVKTAPPL